MPGDINIKKKKTKKIKKKKKNTWRYHHLHKCAINDNHIMYAS